MNSIGRAMLAFLPDDERESILSRIFPNGNKTKIKVTRKKLERELKKYKTSRLCRKQGPIR
jgi:DNA-binding IclR family transcriptional regulator